jgi:hypothetical protein
MLAAQITDWQEGFTTRNRERNLNQRVQELIEELVAAEGWPDPKLLEAILAEGSEAIDPLLEVVHQEVYGWPEAEVLCQACLLLGGLEARSAIPDLVDLFYRYDSDLLEDVYRALVMLGSEVVKPALQAVRNASLNWYSRAMASQAVIEVASEEEELRTYAASALCEILAEYVSRADTLADEEIQMVTTLVGDLASLAVPEARELIDTAFEKDIVERWVITPRDVTTSYRKGGGASPSSFDDWLRRYRRDYRDYLARKRREEREAKRSKPRMVGAGQSKRRELGRNAPCWCGSGKKYKHCHLRKDQGRE